MGFFNCWTRKEAFINALGDGLYHPLDRFDVSLTPGEPAKILRVGSTPGDHCGWRMESFTPAPGLVAAVCYRESETSRRFRPVLPRSGLIGNGAMTPLIETYELSPMQAGMLFHALSGEDPGVDIAQAVATLHEPLDEAHFLRAWQRVLDRHPILRSRFRWEGVAEPVQDVIDRVQIPVERFDWRDLADAERRQRFHTLLDHDRARGFDLGQAPLMRLALVRAAECEHWVLWTYHHAVLDGRARLLVLREVFAFHEAFSRGGDADLPLPRPYRDYIEWLRKLDHDAAKPYWQGALSGFRAPTSLGGARDHEAEHVTGGAWGAHEARLSTVLTTALRERAREASVTLNNLLQGAWALLLHRYSGESDIVFGATRACRRSALSGADDMVGLFINTLAAWTSSLRWAVTHCWASRRCDKSRTSSA